jgi:cardiolipin synthase
MPVEAASHFRWLRTGEDALEAMLEAIEAAQQSVRLETYIFTAGPVGEAFRDALARACRRGTPVRVLVDGLGSWNLLSSFWEPLTVLGGEFRWFNPLALRRLAYRDHRKVLVCDERVAFVGGFNIAPEYAGDGVERGWRDLGLRITGPLAQELARTFDTYFARADFKHKKLQRLRKAVTDELVSGDNWTLLLSGPSRGHNALKRVLVHDLALARDVRIMSAYFLPTWRIRKELVRAARRGGRVQLVLAGKSDVSLARLAARRLYRSLMRAGVEIYEYQPQILHAKVFLLDDVLYVGSANLDVRSLNINYELSVRVHDPTLAAEGREIFDTDLQHSQRIDPVTWRKSRSLWSKLKEDWAYFVLARLDPYLARRQLKALG